MTQKVYVFDIETFANTFSLVGKERETGEFIEFIIHEDDSLGHFEDMMLWLSEKPMLVGYNNLDFDGQVIEQIWKQGISSGREIYAFAQSVIETKDKFNLPYKPWELTHNHLDLMALSHYGIYGKSTSLKWLEFTTRQRSVKDLPFHHSQELEEKHFDDLIRYNRQDVIMTDNFYGLCEKAIAMRNTLAARYQDKMILNQPNSSIGEKIVLYSYCEYTRKNKYQVKKRFTRRKRIALKDVILDYIEFKEPVFNEVLGDFKKVVLNADSKGVMQLKGKYEKEVEFQDMHITYALGGIHGCVPPGIYRSTDTHVIKTCDVTSMYPNIAIANKFYPEHLGPEFCIVYENILKERKRYPKDTHGELNAAFKEAANSVYGKSNASTDNFLKDPMYTLKTTINGQLVLTMLCEWLSQIGEFITLNTDGVELIIPRDKEEEYFAICDRWEKLTGVNLEHDEYETMWIKDVNNYIAKFTNGKVKRKGMFSTYEDYIGKWHGNASGLIIPEAIQAYFLEGIDPADTITNWENIHDFLYGHKGSGGGSFSYLFFDIQDSAIVNIKEYTERAVRYYVSTEGGSILKWWKRGKKSQIGIPFESVAGTKGQKIKMLMSTPDIKGEIFRTIKRDDVKVTESRYPDLDYEYYIKECWRWIDLIENKTYIAEETNYEQV